MQEDFVNSLLESISDSRLNIYRDKTIADNDSVAFARYLWNIELSESLYPVLHGVEVVLRNSVHSNISRIYDSVDWFDAVSIDREARALKDARDRLKSQNKNSYPDSIVSTLTFGFWVNLFHRRYEQTLWPRLLSEVFPYMPDRIRTRRYVYRRLERIRNLRNRVFHHEPVWHWNDLAQHHQEALEVIGWINPDMLSIVTLVDRFPEVYARGPDRYQEELLRLGGGNS